MFSSPRNALTPVRNKKPATQRTIHPKGTSERCRTIRNNEKGMMQNAKAMHKLATRLA